MPLLHQQKMKTIQECVGVDDWKCSPFPIFREHHFIELFVLFCIFLVVTSNDLLSRENLLYECLILILYNSQC